MATFTIRLSGTEEERLAEYAEMILEPCKAKAIRSAIYDAIRYRKLFDFLRGKIQRQIVLDERDLETIQSIADH